VVPLNDQLCGINYAKIHFYLKTAIMSLILVTLKRRKDDKKGKRSFLLKDILECVSVLYPEVPIS